MTFKIAIDGYAAAGKGTIAKGVAGYFGFSYLDTGLIYRAVAQLALSKSKGTLSKDALIDIARSFEPKHLELENLRSDQVGTFASKISALPEIRLELINFQRCFASKGEGSILDGRDIGTIVIPDARLKLFVTADLNIRAQRRYKDLYRKDKRTIFSKVMNDLSNRDQLDSNREHAPLKISSDAHLIDTTELSIEASIAYVIKLVNSIRRAE